MEQKGYAQVLTAQPQGIGAQLVTVEADLSRGLHAFSIVGLADKAVGEARDRISSAIKSAGYKPPKATNRRIVLSLSPASLRKDGSQYDVPLAVAYLIAAGHLPTPRERMLFCGELGLDGSVRPVQNVLAHARCAKETGIPSVFVPAGNVQEALLVRGIRAYSITHLSELVAHLRGERRLPAAVRTTPEPALSAGIDFANIRGQESAKRALLVAAAGRHNVMLYGPPGAGKTMLARALPSILPPLTEAESMTATAIHSAAGGLTPGKIITQSPLRAPHHTISTNAMVGGGPSVRPGEISLAHAGVLFMDEFVEFDSRTLEALRQPLEDKQIRIARTAATIALPADFMLVAAMNPADTVASDDSIIRQQMQRQAKKLSKPIMDRIDLWVAVPRVPSAELIRDAQSTASKDMRKLVVRARERLKSELQCSAKAEETLHDAAERLSLSARSIARVVNVGKSIAALEDADRVELAHLLEALQYRPRMPGIA